MLTFLLLLTVQTAAIDDVVTVVEAREVAFAATMAAHDLDAFGAFVSEEAIFLSGTGPLRGRTAVVEGWSRFFEGDTAPFLWKPDQVHVLASGRLAQSSGPATGANGEDHGRFNSIWRLEDDGVWRVVFDKSCP